VPAGARAKPNEGESIVLFWNAAALQGVRDSKLGPPMVARALAIVHTCAYDAWAAYDHRAIGTRLGGTLRRPPRERTLDNKKVAISYAAYRALTDLFSADKASVFDPLMRDLGLDPNDVTADPTTPIGVGNIAAKAVLQYRHRDGANQLGDEAGGVPGVPYSDYTGYRSADAPMDIRAAFDQANVHDPNLWQPLRYVDGTGALVTQAFVGAQWQHVDPFALTSSAQLRSSTGPARYGSTDYLEQAEALLELSAGLTDEHKMIAEYWADGPHSELPPGHWDLFAQFVSHRDHHGAGEHGVDADVKLFFALTNAIFDASICCWDGKRAFASVRPITALRYLFHGQQVLAWAGYTKRDRFGASVTLSAGSSRTEPGVVPARDLTLSWATFSQAADQAGISRRYGGIHFERGDMDGRRAGRMVAKMAWDKAQSYIDGPLARI
jgi:hypothetical protein